MLNSMIEFIPKRYTGINAFTYPVSREVNSDAGLASKSLLGGLLSVLGKKLRAKKINSPVSHCSSEDSNERLQIKNLTF